MGLCSLRLHGVNLNPYSKGICSNDQGPMALVLNFLAELVKVVVRHISQALLTTGYSVRS